MIGLTLHNLFVQRLMEKQNFSNDFSNFTFPSKFASKIYNKDFTLQEAEDNQQELKILINKLNNNYNPKIKEKQKKKEISYSLQENCFLLRKKLLEHLREVFFRTLMDLKWKKNQMKMKT